MSLVKYFTLCWFYYTFNYFYGCCFTCAVWPEKTETNSGFNGKTDIVHRANLGVLFYQALNFKNILVIHGLMTLFFYTLSQPVGKYQHYIFIQLYLQLIRQ